VSTLSERIREARERKAYGQAELARAIGMTPTSLWAIEAGRHVPRPATLRKIADVLGVPVEELTMGTGA
jgi:transcriptional regulator with XRE-family HTH domain